MTEKILLVALGLCITATVTAQEESFFTDPSLLETWEFLYVVP